MCMPLEPPNFGPNLKQPGININILTLIYLPLLRIARAVNPVRYLIMSLVNQRLSDTNYRQVGSRQISDDSRE